MENKMENKMKGKKKHIISIAGDLASGKGTVSAILAKKLGYTIYKNGEYFRKLAKDHNMDVTEFNKYVEKHPEIDRQIENSARLYSIDHDNFIIDARLGWYAVPESFKIYLKVDTDEAAKRAFYDVNRKSTENFNTIEEQKKRYFNLYGVHKEDLKNYDLIIDTTNLAPEQVTEMIYNEYINWYNK